MRIKLALEPQTKFRSCVSTIKKRKMIIFKCEPQIKDISSLEPMENQMHPTSFVSLDVIFFLTL